MLLIAWSKFIVVVPSIAIREGVKKSFEITQDHFMEQYRGYRISEIDPITGSVTFTNGEMICKGDVVDDVILLEQFFRYDPHKRGPKGYPGKDFPQNDPPCQESPKTILNSQTGTGSLIGIMKYPHLKIKLKKY